MRKNFKFIDNKGKEINCYKWEENSSKKVIVYIVHGMAEQALRYDYFARKLTQEGYIVYSHDHRGHGNTDRGKKRGYISDNEGFEVLVYNLNELIENAKKENPEYEIVLCAHSMGSFVSLRFLELYGQSIDRVILSGTNGKLEPIAKIGAILARIEIALYGRMHKSKMMDNLIFGKHNNRFKPNRTKFDWICSNEEAVDEYINDENSGFICSASFYYDLIRGINRLHKKQEIRKIKKTTKFYIFSGDCDPVGNFGKGIKSLVDELKSYGILDVKYKLYKNGRHEMLNEKNKDEVIDSILNFLKY
ncbi:MAG: lysophospholipase [Sarcina sp.]